jgi:predicted DCC family thiol-disulfide oxidoreductase YuxK
MVARNRYRLFGQTETCLLPTPELMRHFLNCGAPRG